ncbi:MAG: CopG family transcriptional regulator [Acidobacteria bacterium]|nr:CopG family transcriptional regulator [Acidobacteriota bacterium]MCH8269194.1 CopG family transcriptional regulator [Acidobacteriota bacterium]MCZ6490801.1 CopG family transcriptional regulator [Acidobacteriota bacterium]MCZ6752777.1 CopG family transcriptional regulator [Acidobacteriota bacterium]
MSNMHKRATVYFDSQLHKALRLKAAETERSVSALVNDAVKRILMEMEDAEDLAACKQRASEPNLLFEDVLKDLKKPGRL